MLWKNYRNYGIVNSAQREVENIRRRALYTGLGTTSALLFANEFARLTMRSPLFKLKPLNALAVLFVPTFAARSAYDCEIHERIDNLWRIHENRSKKGLEPTADNANRWAMKGQREKVLELGPNEMYMNVGLNYFKNNPLKRGSDIVDKYPQLYQTHNRIDTREHGWFLREEMIGPKKGTYNYVFSPITFMDTDEKLQWYSYTGETPYTDPPHENSPTIDYGLDEDRIWNFHINAFNQNVVINKYLGPLQEMVPMSHLPKWADKLTSPAFFTQEKLFKALWQEKKRKELDEIM